MYKDGIRLTEMQAGTSECFRNSMILSLTEVSAGHVLGHRLRESCKRKQT